MPILNYESKLGIDHGTVITGLRTIEITIGNTDKENSSLHSNDGKHETCVLLRTEKVQEKLCSRMQDKEDLQKNVGLSESNANDEKSSEKTELTEMGESNTLAETNSCRTEVQEKQCSGIQDKEDLQKNVGLSESNTNDEKSSDKTELTEMGESKTLPEINSCRTDVQEKQCSGIQDKEDLQKNVGLSESNTSDGKNSDETEFTAVGESKTLFETGDCGTEVQEKLCNRIEDKMDFQKCVGLSESVANDETVSDKTNFTAMGGSETCLDADTLRTEEANRTLCSEVQDNMNLEKCFGLNESDTSGEKISDETNATTIMDHSKSCLEVDEKKCGKIETNVKQGLNDVTQIAGASCIDSEKQIFNYNPIIVGGSAAEINCTASTGSDKTCGTNVNLTSTANRCQKTTANLNGILQSGTAAEVNSCGDGHGVAASRLVVIKTKDDFTVSRSSSGTASNRTVRPVAKLLLDVGLDLVTEWVCRDLIRIQTQTTTSPLSEAEKNRQLSVLSSNKQRLSNKNKAFAFRKRRCTCGFWSESQIVLAYHSQFGDVSRNGDMYCCLCVFTALKPRYFIRHMKRRHKLKALGTVKVAQYQCHFCPFENNHQVRLESHLSKCRKLFDLNCNLCPVRVECDIPVFVTPWPLSTVDIQKNQSAVVTSAAALANQVFPTGGKLSQIPLHSSMPSCSLVIQHPQQCATIPSSAALSLSLARFIVTPSRTPGMPQIQLSVVPPKNSAQPRSVVSPVVTPLMPVVAPGQMRALPPATQNSLQSNVIISPSQRGHILSTNLAQNLSQTRLTIPPFVGKDVSQPLGLGMSSSVTMVQPERCLFVPPGLGSDLLRMQLLASPQGQIVQFQNPRYVSGAETRFFQVGNQMFSFVQHQGRSVLSPLIFPPPILPLNPSFTLNPLPPNSSRQTVSLGRPNVMQNSSQMSSFMLSSNVSLPRDAASSVRMPRLPPSSNTNQLSVNLEICELCDGFVKDRRSLSVHFRNAHRVVIDDLNCVIPSQLCSLCTRSFFTISGLLRHYHLIHASDSSLIMPLMRCSLCQKLNLKNAVEHLSSDHKNVMSISHEFRHCGICSLRLSDVHSFEKHMLLVHGNIFNSRNILLATIAASLPDKTQSMCDSNSSGLEVKRKEFSKNSGKNCHACRTCGKTYLTGEELNKHTITSHMHKCSRCPEAFNSLPSLRRHFHVKHSTDRETCTLCLKTVQIGRPFIRHMKSQHLKDCSVQIERMHNSDVLEHPAKCRTIDSEKLVNSSLKETRLMADNESLIDDEDLSSKSAKKQKLEYSWRK